MSAEVEALKAQIETLEQLLEVNEETVQQQLKTIRAQQRLLVERLDTPILTVWEGVLVLPVIGDVDAERSARITETALAAIDAEEARWLILDVTGVGVIDTETASNFLRVAQAVEILGARCLLAGVRPEVAQALVALGIDLRRLSTQRDLHQALRVCLGVEGEVSRRAR